MILMADAGFSGDLLCLVVLLILAAFFYLIEICTPTFGIMAGAGIIAEIAAVYFAYSISPDFGKVTLIVCLVGTPTYLYFMIKFLPKTPFGKILMLKKARDASNDATPEADDLQSLKGVRGKTLCLLRPVGKVKINGRTYDARAEIAFIEEGLEIEVIETSGTDVVVRQVKS